MKPLALRVSAARVWFAVVAVALVALAFWPTFLWMAQRFGTHDSFYSHGWLIPLASGWLAWQKRTRLQGLPRHPSYWGLLLVVPALILHIVATWWKIHVVSGLAMLMTCWGLVWTCWGWQVVWVLRFPLLFLLFMVPLPSILLIAVSFKMKLLAASLATVFLRLLGIPALQGGSTIQVPGVSVIVDDTCSGLRSLISLVALATFWTSLMPPTSRRWQRLTMVAASLPIALAANWARIIVLVLTAAIYGPKAAEGFIHYGSGLVVFGVALLALAGVSRLVSKSAVVTP